MNLKIFKKILLILLLSLNLYSLELTNNQQNVLSDVINITSELKDSNGVSYPKIMASICFVESNFGKFKVNLLKNKESYGVMQVRVKTAKLISELNPKYSYINNLNNNQIAKKLLNDDKFNIEIATLYFIYIKNKYKNVNTAISAYNGGFKNIKYVKKILNSSKIF